MVGKRWYACVSVCHAAWCAALLSFVALTPAFGGDTPSVGEKPGIKKVLRTSRAGVIARRAQLATVLPSAVVQQSESAPTTPDALELTPGDIRFPEVPAGEMSSQTVRVTNAGEGLVQISKIVAPGPEFRVLGQGMPFVITRGTSADFTITYRPKAEGGVTGRLLIYTDTRRDPIGVNLTASAISAQNELIADTGSLDFPDVAMGSRSVKEISVTNAGNRLVSIASVNVSDDREFSVTGANAASLEAGQTMTFAVSFSPTSVGERKGMLKISSRAGDDLEIPLTAMGAAGSQSAVRLQWEENPAGVAGYTVYRAADASGPYERIAADVSSAEYLDSGLAAGHTYFYVVSSMGPDQTESEYSDPISATVPEG